MMKNIVILDTYSLFSVPIFSIMKAKYRPFKEEDNSQI